MTICNAKAEKPVQGRADTEVHQVFHQNIAGVLGPGKAGLAHRKARLHEENQGSAQQDPNGVRGRVRHFSHFRFRRISNKKGAGCVQHTLAPCWNVGILIQVSFLVKGINNQRTMNLLIMTAAPCHWRILRRWLS